MPGALEKLEQIYGTFHRQLKHSVGSNEASPVAVTGCSLEFGLGILKEACGVVEPLTRSGTEPIREGDAILRVLAKLHALIFRWVTPALIGSAEGHQLHPALELLFYGDALVWPVALESFAALLRAQGSPSMTFGSGGTATFWLTVLGRLIANFSFTGCVALWEKWYPADLRQRWLPVRISSLCDTYFSIPSRVANSRLELAHAAASTLAARYGQISNLTVVSNFFLHTGRLLARWLLAIDADDKLQLGLFGRTLQKVHRIGHLDAVVPALNGIPAALLSHSDFQPVARPFLERLMQVTHKPIEGLVWEGFGSSTDPADPVGQLIVSCGSFKHPFIRNAVLPLLVDLRLEPPLPARLATHLVALKDERLLGQLLHFLFMGHWPGHDFFIRAGLEAHLSRCYLLAFLVARAPGSALSSIAAPARRQISLALQATNQEARVLELLVAQAIVNKARLEDQPILDLPLGHLSPRAMRLKELLDGNLSPGPDLQTCSAPEEETATTTTAPVLEAKYPAPKYLLEAIIYLKTTEEDERFQLGVDHIFSLIQSADGGVLDEVAPDLIRILAVLPSSSLRAQCQRLVLTRSFKRAARPLVELLYTNMALEHQLGALAALRQAVLALAEPPLAEDSELRSRICSDARGGVVTWKSARLVTRSITHPTAEGRGLFPSQVFFPLIRPLRVGAQVSFTDVMLLEGILMLLSTTLYFSYHLPELDLMGEAYMGLLGHLRLHPDPKIQAAVLLGYASVLPRSPSPRWHALMELPSLLDFCQDLSSHSKHAEVVKLAEMVGLQVVKMVEHVRSQTFL
ncbi:hypothetical protein L0F63_003499 [Massospora cicadina]|nr:hypothetical protein L0F63_003499 [Massospora cicadina]